MGRALLKTSLLILLLTPAVAAESVYTLILKGKLDEARDSLSQVATASTRDGDILFYQSLLEPDAVQAARLMETALESQVTPRHQEEITFRLAQYYLVKRNYAKLSPLVVEYRSRWENGKHRDAVARMSVLVDEHDGALESALRQCDRFLVDQSGDDANHWGLIDKARLMTADSKRIGANETLRRLSRERKGVGIPISLYMLGQDAIRRDRPDDAIFFYNIFREGYPGAVGLDELLVGLGEMTDRSKADNQAEKLTGTFYSVKVGVFSKSGNARRQADIFKAYDREIEIKAKKISGQDYRVVYVGRFQDYEDAVRFKLQLEATHHEAFQVVAR
jgi:hypothetical protein